MEPTLLRNFLNKKIRGVAEREIPKHLLDFGFNGDERELIMELVLENRFGIPAVDLAFSPAQPSRHVASIIADRVITSDLLYKKDIAEEDLRSFRAHLSVSFLSKKSVSQMQADELETMNKLRRWRNR